MTSFFFTSKKGNEKGLFRPGFPSFGILPSPYSACPKNVRPFVTDAYVDGFCFEIFATGRNRRFYARWAQSCSSGETKEMHEVPKAERKFLQAYNEPMNMRWHKFSRGKLFYANNQALLGKLLSLHVVVNIE